MVWFPNGKLWAGWTGWVLMVLMAALFAFSPFGGEGGCWVAPFSLILRWGLGAILVCLEF